MKAGGRLGPAVQYIAHVLGDGKLNLHIGLADCLCRTYLDEFVVEVRRVLPARPRRDRKKRTK